MWGSHGIRVKCGRCVGCHVTERSTPAAPGTPQEVARQPPTAAEDQEAVEAEAGSSSLPSLASRCGYG